MQAKVFPEITGYSSPTTGQATVKPSLLQPTNYVPHKTAAARSTDGHVTSQTVAKTSSSETLTTNTTIEVLATTSPVTTKSTLPTTPTTHTLVTTLATPNKSHVTFPVTEAKVGLSVGPSSPPVTVNPTAHTTGNRPSTASHTTGKTTQLSNQTTLPATLSTSPHNITTSQKPTQPTHTPGPTTATYNTTQTASPATIAPRPTLAPQPLSPKTGIYQVHNGSKLCIKAEMGIQLTVQDSVSVSRSHRTKTTASKSLSESASLKTNIPLHPVSCNETDTCKFLSPRSSIKRTCFRIPVKIDTDTVTVWTKESTHRNFKYAHSSLLASMGRVWGMSSIDPSLALSLWVTFKPQQLSCEMRGLHSMVVPTTCDINTKNPD